jgi:hypothetical protein
MQPESRGGRIDGVGIIPAQRAAGRGLGLISAPSIIFCPTRGR